MVSLSPQLQQYQHTVQQFRFSPYMNFPSHVHMETMSLCTAACNFCPYPTLDRIGTKMSDELITKIITDLTEIPKHLPFQLSPFKVNEPFLDTRLFDILHTVNEKLPNAALTLTSNASPLTAKNLQKLLTVKGLDYLWISFNDHRPEHYTQTMQLPWARTIERLDMLHKAKAEGQLTCHVFLSRVGDGTATDQEFQQWVHEHYPLFKTFVFQRGGWLGQANVTNISADVPNTGCTRWYELSIMSTGKVAHCCMDGKGEWSIGDVNTQHVLDVYNSPEYRKLRERTISRRDVSPCNTCTFL